MSSSGQPLHAIPATMANQAGEGRGVPGPWSSGRVGGARILVSFGGEK